MSNIHSINVTTIDGQEKQLSDYAGKVLLIVNVASKCGLTPQYDGLEKLYQDQKDQGLEILAFPCNQFGGQEPGSEAEIQNFCSTKFNVSFPLFKKIEVNGPNRHPLYQTLMSAIPHRTAAPESNFAEKMKNYGIEPKEGDIFWNFEKFLVDREGEVVAHFSPDTTPDNPIFINVLDKLLA